MVFRRKKGNAEMNDLVMILRMYTRFRGITSRLCTYKARMPESVYFVSSCRPILPTFFSSQPPFPSFPSFFQSVSFPKSYSKLFPYTYTQLIQSNAMPCIPNPTSKEREHHLNHTVSSLIFPHSITNSNKKANTRLVKVLEISQAKTACSLHLISHSLARRTCPSSNNVVVPRGNTRDSPKIPFNSRHGIISSALQCRTTQQ